MTSSLVGSEMCIRDSLCRVCVDPGRRRCASPPGPGCDGEACLSGNCGVCLLYTSDAADDM
eukprot:12729501-Prorocentrum_lima.AAC.1